MFFFCVFAFTGWELFCLIFQHQPLWSGIVDKDWLSCKWIDSCPPAKLTKELIPLDLQNDKGIFVPGGTFYFYLVNIWEHGSGFSAAGAGAPDSCTDRIASRFVKNRYGWSISGIFLCRCFFLIWEQPEAYLSRRPRREAFSSRRGAARASMRR